MHGPASPSLLPLEVARGFLPVRASFSLFLSISPVPSFPSLAALRLLLLPSCWFALVTQALRHTGSGTSDITKGAPSSPQTGRVGVSFLHLVLGSPLLLLLLFVLIVDCSNCFFMLLLPLRGLRST